MINYMNVGDESINEIRLHGNHVADIVYCVDCHYASTKSTGRLYARDIILATKEELRSLDHSTLAESARIYYGVVHVDKVYIGSDYQEQAEQNSLDVVEKSDMYFKG
ncbi:hypothetical protein [Escherichia phage UPEC07]|nr:hypothetical protein [Escherichia phage UPEC07]